ncbi:MAG: hypothetical protein AB9897_04720 [Anaerolineaceae bacterium]
MKRPITFTVAAALVLLLILISSIWPMLGGERLLGGAPNSIQGSLPPSPRGPSSNQLDPAQNGSLPDGQGIQPGDGTQFQPANGMGVNNAGSMLINRILLYALYALYAVILILGLIAIGGLWVSKRWGVVLAILTSVVVMISAIPQLFRQPAVFSLIENLLKVLLAIGIIVLVLIPRRKHVDTVVDQTQTVKS